MKVCINNIVTEKIRKSIAIVVFYELTLKTFIKLNQFNQNKHPHTISM